MKPQFKLAASIMIAAAAAQVANPSQAAPGISGKVSASAGVVGPQNVVAGEILVTYKVDAKSAGAVGVRSLLGARVLNTFGQGRVQALKLPANLSIAKATELLKKQSVVEAVQPNYRYGMLANESSNTQDDDLLAKAKKAAKVSGYKVNDPSFKKQWGMTKIQADLAWTASYSSTEIVVAVMDSGINYNHEDLSGAMWRNDKEIPGNGFDDDANGYIDDYYGIDTGEDDSSPLDDKVGHGTHVAGIIAAVGNNGKGIAGVGGVKGNIKLMALKIADAAGGVTTTAKIREAMDYIVLMKQRDVNIRVTNQSWGGWATSGTAYDPILKVGYDTMGAQGIISAVAAGNSNFNNDNRHSYPANYSSPGIISVAASDSADKRANFSNFGPQTVHIAAPGKGILSTYPFVFKGGKKTYPGGDYTKPPIVTPVTSSPSNKAYDTMDGTSMAAPHVAGAAALLIAFNPNLTMQQVFDSLQAGVDKGTTGYWNSLVRWGGRLNIARSLNYVHTNAGIPGVTPPPSPTATPVVPPTPTATPGPTATPTIAPTPTPTPTATPTPTPPPTGGNGDVVYSLGTQNGGLDIFRIPRNGGTPVNLTNNAADDFSPTVNQQDNRIVFVSTLNDELNPNFTYNNELYIMNGDGSQQTRLTFYDYDDRDPSWSPDGAWIAFVRDSTLGGAGTPNYDIYVMRAFPENTNPNAGASYNKPIRITNNPGTDRDPAWSRDRISGKWRIAFTSDRADTRPAPGGANDGSTDNDVWMTSFDPSNPTEEVNLENAGTNTNVPFNLTGGRAGGLANGAFLDPNQRDDRNPDIGPLVYSSAEQVFRSRVAYQSDRSGTFDIYTVQIDNDTTSGLNNIGVPTRITNFTSQGDNSWLIPDKEERPGGDKYDENGDPTRFDAYGTGGFEGPGESHGYLGGPFLNTASPIFDRSSYRFIRRDTIVFDFNTMSFVHAGFTGPAYDGPSPDTSANPFYETGRFPYGYDTSYNNIETVEEIDPHWSPDGNWIVFSTNARIVTDTNSNEPDNDFDLWVIGADSRGQYKLTSNMATRPGDYPQSVSRSFAFAQDTGPAWMIVPGTQVQPRFFDTSFMNSTNAPRTGSRKSRSIRRGG